jgi:iron complex transport system substrate-binding protein
MNASFLKIQRKRIGLLGLVLLLSALPARARQVEDAFGRLVTVPDQVRRVVVLSRDMLELVRIVGAMDRVVGVSDTVRRDPGFWPELAHIPQVGRWNDPDYEAIARLAPDLVLAYGRYPGPEAEVKLAAAHIALLRLEVYLLSGFDRAARSLGAALGESRAMETFLDWRRAQFARLAACRREANSPPLVYLEGYQRLTAWGPGTSGDESLSAGGGRNLAASLPTSHGEVSPEWILAGAPEAIVKITPLAGCYAAQSAEALRNEARAIADRPGFAALTAVSQGRIYVLASDIHGGPRAPIGAAYLARWLHPGQCRDIDPDALNREYLERFQGMPAKGAFAWPPLETPDTPNMSGTAAGPGAGS